jgi:hypothetical protein
MVTETNNKNIAKTFFRTDVGSVDASFAPTLVVNIDVEAIAMSAGRYT